MTVQAEIPTNRPSIPPMSANKRSHWNQAEHRRRKTSHRLWHSDG